MTSIQKRLAFDAVLTVLLIIEMFIQYTGVYVHEVIGFVFMATLAAHLAVERKWIAGSFKKGAKMNKKRRNKLVMAAALLVDTVLLGVSSVVISNIVFDAGVNLLWLNLTGVWTTVHSVTAHALAALTLGHLAMHWSIIAAQFKVRYDPGRRAVVGAGVSATAAFGVIAVGAAASEFAGIAAALASTIAEETGGRSTRPTVASYKPAEPKAVLTEPAAKSAEAPLEAVEETAAWDEGATEPNDSAESDAEWVQESEESYEEPVQAYEEASDWYEESTEWTQEPVDWHEEPTDWVEESYDWYEEPETSWGSSLGTCSLCHKGCSLASPQCNKPYAAGLI